MDLTSLQKEVDNWIKEHGVRYFNELTNTALLMEEVGELARIMARKYGEQSYKESDVSSKLEEEIADVLFVLTCIANQTGVNLQKAFKQNLHKKSIRDAKRHKENKKLN
jgi:NTP pyrophosphatase (non-canonical NTP hydrolase)